MTTWTMKWIDQWAGIPLCLMLSALRQPMQWFRPVRSGVHHALFIKLMGMGSMVLTTPAVRSIKQNFPDARLHFVTFQSNKALAENIHLFDTVLTIRSSSFGAFVWDTWQAVRFCWNCGIDVVFDFEFFSRFSTILSFVSGARRRVGFYSVLAWRGWLLTDPVYFNHYRHMTENFLAQARVLGLEAENKSLVPLQIFSQDNRRVEELLNRAGVPADAPLVVVNVNAGDMCLERRWPAIYYKEFVEMLRERYPETWIIFPGSSAEQEYVSQVLAQWPDQRRLLSVAGQLTLGQLAALLKRAQVLITSESGPLHFAQSLDVPTVSLFGPGPPLLFKPLGPKHRFLYAAVDCSPCLNYYSLTGPICRGDNICMKYIKPSEVLQVVEELLDTLRTAFHA